MIVTVSERLKLRSWFAVAVIVAVPVFVALKTTEITCCVEDAGVKSSLEQAPKQLQVMPWPLLLDMSALIVMLWPTSMVRELPPSKMIFTSCVGVSEQPATLNRARATHTEIPSERKEGNVVIVNSLVHTPRHSKLNPAWLYGADTPEP